MSNASKEQYRKLLTGIYYRAAIRRHYEGPPVTTADGVEAVAAQVLRDVMREFGYIITDDADTTIADELHAWAYNLGIDLGEQ